MRKPVNPYRGWLEIFFALLLLALLGLTMGRITYRESLTKPSPGPLIQAGPQGEDK